jgi:hypothetical protein
MSELRLDHFRNHKKRTFKVVEFAPIDLTLSEQGTTPAIWWSWVPPLSVNALIGKCVRENGLPNALGLTVTGHMPGGPETMTWRVSYEKAKERKDERAMTIFTAKAIAYDAARNRLEEVEVRDGDERMAVFRAMEQINDRPRAEAWATVEIVVS